jgi:uncharacterized protein (TIGR02996 family)
MTDEEGFLRSIAAQAEEDTPRLAYADWLEEHGLAIRAEFIRLQCDIARKETLPRAVLNRHVNLFQRQQELLDHHRAELLWPLVLPGDIRVEFRRGFVSVVEMQIEHFLHFGDPIVSLRPLPALRVLGVMRRLGEFLRAPHLEAVAHVGAYSRTSASTIEWSDDGLEILRGVRRLGRLESVDLEGCGLTDLFCDLIYNFSLPRVSDLDMSSNQITDEGVINLLRSDWPGRLRRLILGGNPIGDQGAIELADRWPRDSKLENLNLRFTNIGQAGQQALLARFGSKVDLF